VKRSKGKGKAKVEKEFEIIAIHGEGDQQTVNDLQAHRNMMDMHHYKTNGMAIPAHLESAPDEQPDIIIVLRDADHQFRIEWPVETWEEVEQWKQIAGFDPTKRHWKHGAKVKVTIGG
jgi:hypothetical protein